MAAVVDNRFSTGCLADGIVGAAKRIAAAGIGRTLAAQ